MKLQGSISANETLNGDIQKSNSLIGSINNLIGGFDKCVSEVKIENKILYLIFVDGTSYEVDLSNYIDDLIGLTEEQKEAINNMVAILNEELSLEYDDELLDIEFKLEDGNLIVINNEEGLDFSINNNGEMEAMY